jgi:hypothetical protein
MLEQFTAQWRREQDARRKQLADSVLFRAHSVGNLLVGGSEISDRQRDRLHELATRAADPNAKALTDKMRSELDDLIAKRDAPFAFGATALSYIRECWLRNEYAYDEPVLTNELLKGLLCEDEAIGVLTRQVPSQFRIKNDVLYTNAWFAGTPDVILDDAVEDVKCAWTLKTFVDIQHPSALYYAQGQAYMDLTGRNFFRLCHVLVDTPEIIVQEERKRYYFRFNCDEENPYYQECVRKVDAMHAATALIPENQRIKVFTIPRDDLYIARLRKRVEQAREVYATLTIGGIYGADQ